MAEVKGYISGSKFVPSSSGKYTRNTNTGIVTDTSTGITSGASYETKHLTSSGQEMGGHKSASCYYVSASQEWNEKDLKSL